MAVRLCVVLLLLHISMISAKSDVDDRVCGACTTLVKKLKQLADDTEGSSQPTAKSLAKVCEQAPEEQQERCKKAVKQSEATLKLTAGKVEGVCEKICKEGIPTEVVPAGVGEKIKEVITGPHDDVRYCRYCMIVVNGAWRRLKIKEKIDDAKSTVESICELSGVISEDDCNDAIDEAMDFLNIPGPKDVCIAAKFCEKRKKTLTT